MQQYRHEQGLVTASLEVQQRRSLQNIGNLAGFKIEEPLGETSQAVANAGLEVSASPNPFNPKTTIEFTLKEVTDWELTVFNILGQEVTQFNGTEGVGAIKVTWDATEYSSGVYLYRLKAGDYTASRKMMLLK